MKILIIGSGGREHALAWKISQSGLVDKIYCAPGNGGTCAIAENLDIKDDDLAELLVFAKTQKIDLTVVGPEAPLVAGVVDLFEDNNLKVFGPNMRCANLEGSKVFAKKIMKRYNVPTADFEVFDKSSGAIEYLEKKGAPIVVKADGLCAGKGVRVCKTIEEAKAAIVDFLDKKIFGKAGRKVVLEECLTGEEASILALVDGANIVPLASSQDHKRIYDNDEGPNTGGMGAYSPAPIAEGGAFNRVIKEIMRPLVDGLKEEGMIYKGVLYAGIMMTGDGPKALEFNVRFGDPETQAILPRLKDDLVDLMLKSIDGKLNGLNLTWDNRSCVCVVMASGGYPGDYEKDKIVEGLSEAEKNKDAVVFHAGTKCQTSQGGQKIFTKGGRVLGVTALGNGIEDAINKAYAAAGKINFEKMHYRRDIGRRALNLSLNRN